MEKGSIGLDFTPAMHLSYSSLIVIVFTTQSTLKLFSIFRGEENKEYRFTMIFIS